MHILIVDDNLTNLKLLRALLESEGHVIFEATDGVEALATLNREPIAAIISDILMPRMDGYRLCYEVRKNERLQRLPFIFYTATYTSRSDEKLCFDLGGDKYLRKPADVEEILAALREAAQSSAQGPANRAGSMSETEVMKEYSERLVSKLEEKNIELQKALEKVQLAHREIVELNGSLARRVSERTAELEVANEELEAFAHSISHDLRAPLRAIDGFLHLFGETYVPLLPAEAGPKLERIHQITGRLDGLIDGLLTFSQFCRRPLHKRDASPMLMVKRVLEDLQAERAGRNVQISIADLPDCQADPILLHQVFMNLLSNALKYSRQRDPAVIEIGWREEKGQDVYFVQDNGVGFDMKYAKNLFGVFQRLHAAGDFEGAGVGLSIVQRIIQRHGGRVWAESARDRGAAFFFTLEQTPPDPESP